MAQDGYSWWLDRFRAMFTYFDIVRIDHFRGFEASWQIPVGDNTAENGTWVKGPGGKLFDAVQATLENCRLLPRTWGSSRQR